MTLWKHVDTRKVTEFLGWAYGIAWISALIVYLAGIEYGTLLNVVLIVIFYMWAPALSAIIVQWRRGESIRRGCGLVWGRLGWMVLAWLAPAALIGANIAIGTLLPNVSFTTDISAFLLELDLPPEQVDETVAALEELPISPLVLFVLLGLGAGLTINALAALGEELGWRGLLLTELSSLGFWRISLFTGFVWGIWHAPIILQGHNFPEAPVAGVAMMTVATLAVAPVFTYLTVRAGSVLAAAFFHGTFNGLGGLSLVYLTGASSFVISPVGVAGIGATLLAVGACVAHDRWIAEAPITTGAALAPWWERAASGDASVKADQFGRVE